MDCIHESMGSQWREARCISLCELLTQLNTHRQKSNGNDIRKKTKEKKKQILLYITEKNNAQQKAFHKVMPTEWMVHFTLSCYCCRWCSFISRNMGFCSVSFVIVLKTDHPLEQNEVSFSLSKLCLISKNARFWSVSFKISPKTGRVLQHTHTI